MLRVYASVERVGTIDQPLAMPWVNGRTIWICRGRKRPLKSGLAVVPALRLGQARQLVRQLGVGFLVGAVVTQRRNNDTAGAQRGVVALRALRTVAAPEVQPVVGHAARIDTGIDVHARRPCLHPGAPVSSGRPRRRGSGESSRSGTASLPQPSASSRSIVSAPRVRAVSQGTLSRSVKAWLSAIAGTPSIIAVIAPPTVPENTVSMPEVQAAVDAGQHELRRRVLHQVADAHRGAVAGRAGDAEAALAALADAQRVVQADGVGLAALVVLGRDDPDLAGDLRRDFLQHRHAGGVDPVVVGQHDPVQHGAVSALRLLGPVLAPGLGRLVASRIGQHPVQKREERAMLIIDAQVHIWGSGTPAPHHRQTSVYTAEELIREMDAAGVNGAVLHPPSWDPGSNEMAIDAADEIPR